MRPSAIREDSPTTAHARGNARAARIGRGSGNSRLRAGFGHPFDFELEIARRLPALLPIFRETSPNRVIEDWWSQWLESDDRRRILFENRRSHTQVAFAGERGAAGQHFVEHGAERENIAAAVEVLAFNLLRGHVLERANDGAFGGDGSGLRCGSGERRAGGEGDRLCQPKVEEFRARLREHDVAGLQVAMGDSASMSLIERIGDLGAEFQNLLHQPARLFRGAWRAFLLRRIP